MDVASDATLAVAGAKPAGRKAAWTTLENRVLMNYM